MNSFSQSRDSAVSFPVAVKQPQQRRAVAAVEFAILLPVVALLVFGSIEAASFIFLKQSLQVAAYEGIREAVRSNATQGQAVTRASDILQSRQIRESQIRFTSGDITETKRGEPIVIEISAPTQSNSPLAGRWIGNRTLTARLLMLKE